MIELGGLFSSLRAKVQAISPVGNTLTDYILVTTILLVMICAVLLMSGELTFVVFVRMFILSHVFVLLMHNVDAT